MSKEDPLFDDENPFVHPYDHPDYEGPYCRATLKSILDRKSQSSKLNTSVEVPWGLLVRTAVITVVLTEYMGIPTLTILGGLAAYTFLGSMLAVGLMLAEAAVEMLLIKLRILSPWDRKPIDE